jgi:RNA polymerase sigma factor (sigma-70 family)
MDISLPFGYEEQDFIKACVRRETWAQKLIYEEFYGSMMALCLRYAGNEEDAMDILHEGFIKVFRNIHKYQPDTSLPAWIRRIMVNTAIDFYRKTVRRRTDDLEAAFDLSSDEADAVSQCSEKQILEAIQMLSPVYRAVFNLFVLEGYSHREIGELLSITESTSRSNLVKARLKLKEILTSRKFGYHEEG